VDKKLYEFFIRPPPPYTNESLVIRYPPMLFQPRINDLAAPQLPDQEKLIIDL